MTVFSSTIVVSNVWTSRIGHDALFSFMRSKRRSHCFIPVHNYGCSRALWCFALVIGCSSKTISLTKSLLSRLGMVIGDRFLNRFIFLLWGTMILQLGSSVVSLIGVDHILPFISILNLRVQFDDHLYEWWWFLVSVHISLVIYILGRNSI